MELSFLLMMHFLMSAIHCLSLNYFKEDGLSFKSILIAAVPFGGNFYEAQYRKSIVGSLYAVFQLLESPALLLIVFFANTGHYSVVCLLLIGILFAVVILRIAHVCQVLWDCWMPVWIIGLFAAGFSTELLYIVGILPYTLQNLFV